MAVCLVVHRMLHDIMTLFIDPQSISLSLTFLFKLSTPMFVLNFCREHCNRSDEELDASYENNESMNFSSYKNIILSTTTPHHLLDKTALTCLEYA